MMIKNKTAALAVAAAFSMAAMPVISASAPRVKSVSAIKIVKKAEEPASIHALIMASKDGDILEVRRQLALGVDPREEDNGALAGAIFGGHVEIAELLLEKGADVHAHNKRFMMLAAMRGHNKMIELLLTHKASVTGNGNQPLAQAAVNGHIDTIDYLLDNPLEKADVNANFGYALAAALDRASAEGVKHLLSRGADSKAGSVQAVYRVIAADPAKMEDPAFKAVIALIDINRAAHPDKSEPDARQPEFEAQVEKPKHELTAQELSTRNLVIAVNTGDPGLMKEALEQGADPDAKGGTPLYTAAMNNNIPAMKMLLEKGANPNLQKGWIMVEALENASADAVMLLLKHGADPLLEGIDAFLESYAVVMEKETPETSPRHFAPAMKTAVAMVNAARATRLAANQESKPRTPSPN